MTDLKLHIEQTPLVDTHEHLNKEAEYVERGPDLLKALFNNYILADLRVAGASEEAVKRLVDASDPDLVGRFMGIREAYEASKHTGYGEGVRLAARLFYGLEEIVPEALEAAQAQQDQLREPGQRLRILRDTANLDHVQIDDFQWACLPDVSGPDFFLYDLSWRSFVNGEIEAEALHNETGIEVTDLNSLREAMAALFAKYGLCAIAVKTQHAYTRTLLWQEREDADTAPILQKRLRGEELTEEERLCLGDWGLARGVELAEQYHLPVKIHTGYYAGHSGMPIERIPAGLLCGLLRRYPQSRFVLMHIAYPYSDELVALAKHFPNVYVDMCWAWSIDPHASSDFVRRMIHAVPSNKLFLFGGDSGWPCISAAYAIQARQGLIRALEAEIADGRLTEKEAIALATRWMRTNQEACFDLAGTRAAIHAKLQEN